jgi:hypothetical protein
MIGASPAYRRAASLSIDTNADRPSLPAGSPSNIGTTSYADAVLDRLVHNAHRLALKGDSMRKITAQRAILDATEKT